MKLSAFIFAGILLAVVPAPLVAQYYGALNQRSTPWPLPLARRGWMIYGRPEYGQNLYFGLLHDNGFQNTGRDNLNHWNDGISGLNMDQNLLQHWGREFFQALQGGSAHLRTGRATGGAMRHAMPTYGQMPNVVSPYFANYHIDEPFQGQGQVKLRRKRSLDFPDGERPRSRKGRRRRPRPGRRPTDRFDVPRPSGQPGIALGRAYRCPKTAPGPLRLTLKVR